MILTSTVKEHCTSNAPTSASSTSHPGLVDSAEESLKAPAYTDRAHEDRFSGNAYYPYVTVDSADKSAIDKNSLKPAYVAPYVTPPKDSFYGARYSGSEAPYTRSAKSSSVFQTRADANAGYYVSGFDCVDRPTLTTESGMHEPHPYYPVHGLRHGSLPNYGYGFGPHVTSSNHPVTAPNASNWYTLNKSTSGRNTTNPGNDLSFPFWTSESWSSPTKDLFGQVPVPPATDSLVTSHSVVASGSSPAEFVKARPSGTEVEPKIGQPVPTSRSKVSISSIIDASSSSPKRAPVTMAGSKRKVDDITADDANTNTAPPTVQHVVENPSQFPSVRKSRYPSYLPTFTGEFATTQPSAQATDQQPQQPPRKKARLVSSAGPFALGVLFGSVGVLGALIALPESLF